MAKNILIVDDAAFMRMMIKDILTKNGYNVVGEAENGLKAVEKYTELKPDLVLMDVFCNGTAGNGYRIHPGRSKGLYCEAVPGRPCIGSC